MTIAALDPADGRTATINVAGPASLLVAKLYKIGERRDTPGRLIDKDAHDTYRLLVATPTDTLAGRLAELREDELAAPATAIAIGHLQELFLAPDRLGAIMAGRAEELAGDPAVVSASTAALAGDLISALNAA